MRAPTSYMPSLSLTHDDWRLRPRATVAAWLPVPAMRRPVASPRTRPADHNSALHRVWLPVAQTFAEKTLFGLLIASAATGIGYGFSCMLHLVQNWAAVNATVVRMVQ